MAITDSETYALIKRYREHPETFTPEQQANWEKLDLALEAWQAEMLASVLFDAAGMLLKVERSVYEAAQGDYDKTVAALVQREQDLPQDDLVGLAEIQLERAKAAAAFKKIDLHWLAINEEFDDSEEKYHAAVALAELHPIVSPDA